MATPLEAMKQQGQPLDLQGKMLQAKASSPQPKINPFESQPVQEPAIIDPNMVEAPAANPFEAPVKANPFEMGMDRETGEIDNGLIQPMTEQQEARLQRLKEKRLRNAAIGTTALPGLTQAVDLYSPGRAEKLLERGVEVNGLDLSGARTVGSFATTPEIAVLKHLQGIRPDADPQSFNIRYVPIVDEKQLEPQMEAAFLDAQKKTRRAIKDANKDGITLSQNRKDELLSYYYGLELKDMDGVELVYTNPDNGRVTAVNPEGLDFGDVGEYAGYSIPTAFEMGGAILGAIGGTAAGGGVSSIPGAMLGTGIGAGIGGYVGEQLRTGIGELLGVEDPDVANREAMKYGAMAAGFNGLTMGLSKFAARKLIEKAQNGGDLSAGALRLARFLDGEEYAANRAVNQEFNALLKDMGLEGEYRGNLLEMANNSDLLAVQAKLKGVDGSVSAIREAENDMLLSKFGMALKPDGSIDEEARDQIKKEFTDYLSLRADQMRGAAQADKEQFVFEQLDGLSNLLKDRYSGNAIAAENVDTLAREIDRGMKEKFRQQYSELADQAPGRVITTPSTAKLAREMIKGNLKAPVDMSPALEQKILAQAKGTYGKKMVDKESGAKLKVSKLFDYEDINKTISDLLRAKRQADAGQVNVGDSDAEFYRKFVDSLNNDMAESLEQKGYGDFIDVLNSVKGGYKDYKQQRATAFGRLFRRDESGVERITNNQILRDVVLGKKGEAPAILALLKESGNESSLSTLKNAIRTYYYDTLTKGQNPGEPLTQSAIVAGRRFLHEHKDQLGVYFDKKELKQFDDALGFVKSTQKQRLNMEKAISRVEKDWGVNLENADPSEILDAMTTASYTQIKDVWNGLPSQLKSDLSTLYRGELLANLRPSVARTNLDAENVGSFFGTARFPKDKELDNLKKQKLILGDKTVKQFETYGRLMNSVMNKMRTVPEDIAGEKAFGNIRLLLFGYLNPTSAKINAAKGLLKDSYSKSIDRAINDPERSKMFVDAVKKFETAESNAALVTAAQAINAALGMQEDAPVSANIVDQLLDDEANRVRRK